MKRSIALFGAAALVLVATGARATDNASLRGSCQTAPESTDALPCRHYIAGFLDGALLTDTAIITSIEQSQVSDFLARAYRTRVGNTRRQKPPPTFLAEFCLPPGVSIDDAARQVHLAMRPLGEDASLQEHVYETVRQVFPCEAER